MHRPFTDLPASPACLQCEPACHIDTGLVQSYFYPYDNAVFIDFLKASIKDVAGPKYAQPNPRTAS